MIIRRLTNFRDNIRGKSLPCYAIEIPEGLSKEGEPYITFCIGEAASYIRDLIKLRESRGETVKPPSYLFTAQDSTEPLSVLRFENLWRELCREAGVDLRPVKIKGRHVGIAKGGERVYSSEGRRYNIGPWAPSRGLARCGGATRHPIRPSLHEKGENCDRGVRARRRPLLEAVLSITESGCLQGR